MQNLIVVPGISYLTAACFTSMGRLGREPRSPVGDTVGVYQYFPVSCIAVGFFVGDLQMKRIKSVAFKHS